MNHGVDNANSSSDFPRTEESVEISSDEDSYETARDPHPEFRAFTRRSFPASFNVFNQPPSLGNASIPIPIGADDRVSRLAEMFRPPHEIMFIGTFDDVTILCIYHIMVMW